MSNNSDNFIVEFTEKELINADVVEKELININILKIDSIPSAGGSSANFIYSEVPTQLTSKRFRTAFAFSSGTLRVLFNGLREKNITIHSTTEFSFGIDILITDEILVDYVK